MSLFNSYIVFIVSIGQSYVTGLTTDIDSTLNQYENEKLNKGQYHLVYQRHFDDIELAKEFESKLNGYDNAKKEAVINGDDSLTA